MKLSAFAHRTREWWTRRAKRERNGDVIAAGVQALYDRDVVERATLRAEIEDLKRRVAELEAE